MSDTTDTWVEVTHTDRIPEGDVVAVTVAGRELALYEAEGQFFATDNLCTHGNARMSDGFLEGCEIECPLHQGRFDIRTGQALCAPLTDNLRTYPIQIQDGRVLVRLD